MERGQGQCTRAGRRASRYEVLALLTTLNEEDERSGMHRIRRELLERQAASLGLPLQFIRLPAFPPNTLYEDRVGAALRPFFAQGVRRAVFGDLFLEDIRAWRDALLRPLGMEGIYPLWGRATAKLAQEFFRYRFRAALVCVDARRLEARFAGREFDAALLKELPAGVDPCGENGEFHTFVFDGPGFASGPVTFTRGDVAVQGDFVYQDLLP
ncbi:MAG: ATP-binding protein [Proteobacteria bacterium]|nr:ATP-binding protein [Pseudomonadota bacterium]